LTPEEQAILDAEKAAKNKGASSDADAMATLIKKNAELERDNKKFRDKNTALREENATIKAASTAKPEDITELAAYRALGKLDDLKATAGKVSAYEREKSLAEIAKKAGYRPEAFLKVAGNAEFEVKAEKVDGKDVEVVTVKGGDGKGIPIDDHFADLLPALKPDADDSRSTGPKGTPRRGLGDRLPPNPGNGQQRQLDPLNPADIGTMLKASGLGAF